MTNDWRIKESQQDWECDWKGSERFQLRYFKALSFAEKCKAVENMCKTHTYFQRKADARRGKSGEKMS